MIIYNFVFPFKAKCSGMGVAYWYVLDLKRGSPGSSPAALHLTSRCLNKKTLPGSASKEAPLSEALDSIRFGSSAQTKKK